MASTYAPDALPQEALSDLLRLWGSRPDSGLTYREAAARLAAEGTNEPARARQVSAWLVFFSQFKSSVVLLLLLGIIIALIAGEFLQALAIAVAVFINALVGFVSEYRARLSLQNLGKLSGSTVRVRRQSCEVNLPVQELVRGDVVILEPGVRVPADLVILECAALCVDESVLTGESTPVWKANCRPAEPPAESTSVFQGTVVLSGRGTAAVFAIGAKTRVGKLGQMLQTIVSGKTPLTESLNVLGQQLSVLVVLLCLVLLALGIMRREPLNLMLETSIALAVAAIPEGLPIVATLALAAGIKRMVKARALIKRLAAVETLGCTTVICADKTGTLTKNELLVSDLMLLNEHLHISGEGYKPEGKLHRKDGAEPVSQAALDECLKVMCLCNDARLENHGDDLQWHIHGDPTEGALLTCAVKLGANQAELQDNFPRLAEIPFELSRKRMSTLHRTANGVLLCTKGAPETVIPLCRQVQTPNGIAELSQSDRQWFLRQNRLLAKRGLRVLAIARRNLDTLPEHLYPSLIENDLVLLALVGMSDRPKENVEAAIRKCLAAGIKVLMLTGDQPDTARAIAQELGIMPAGNSQPVLTGADLQGLADAQRAEVLSGATVIARVTPEAKLAVVKQLQDGGQVVAMTGDGVNDAPALRQANVGVAMGQAGTDLAREVADLVVMDDNFATIIDAIEQGRVTYANIGRAVGYLLTSSLTAVVSITLGLVAHSGLFLQPLQLLYLNLIMHVFPSIGIIMQKGGKQVMSWQPRNPSRQILEFRELLQIAARSTLLGLLTLLSVVGNEYLFADYGKSTVALATLSLSLLLQSWSWLSSGRQEAETSWHLNYPMLLSTMLGIMLLLLAIYVPGLQSVLNTTNLQQPQWLLVLLAAALSYCLSIPINKLL